MGKLQYLLGAKDKDEFILLFKQFIKFGLVGISNTAVSMAVYYIVLFIDPQLYMLGSILGTIIGVIVVLFSKKLSQWEIYAILSLMMILFSGSNYTYCIILMVIPLVTFINTAAEERKVGSFIYAILFLMVFIPIIVNSSADLIAPEGVAIWRGYPLTTLSLMESTVLVALFIFLCIKGIRGLSPLRKIK